MLLHNFEKLESKIGENYTVLLKTCLMCCFCRDKDDDTVQLLCTKTFGCISRETRAYNAKCEFVMASVHSVVDSKS